MQQRRRPPAPAPATNQQAHTCGSATRCARPTPCCAGCRTAGRGGRCGGGWASRAATASLGAPRPRQRLRQEGEGLEEEGGEAACERLRRDAEERGAHTACLRACLPTQNSPLTRLGVVQRKRHGRSDVCPLDGEPPQHVLKAVALQVGERQVGLGAGAGAAALRRRLLHLGGGREADGHWGRDPAVGALAHLEEVDAPAVACVWEGREGEGQEGQHSRQQQAGKQAGHRPHSPAPSACPPSLRTCAGCRPRRGRRGASGSRRGRASACRRGTRTRGWPARAP